MNKKNKQYQIEKGVLLFTQPRSPYFYGKLRVNGKYITKSFAPIEEYDAALDMLFKWRDDIFSAGENNFTIGTNTKALNYRDEYLSHEKLENDFQFLEVGRFDPAKKSTEERKISFV